MSRQEDFKRMAHSHDTESSKYEQECYIDGAEDGYQYALQHPHWIPVEEELPNEQGKYMFRLSNGDMCYETYYPKLKLLNNVTHWMPIIPPRKEDK